MELGTPRVEQVWHLKVSPNSRAAHTCNNSVQDVFPKMLMGQETFTSGSAHLGRSVISLRRKSTISNFAPVPVMCSRSAAEHHESENKHVMMVTNNCVDNVVKIKTQTLKRFQAKVQSDAQFLNPSQLRQGSLFIFQPRSSIKPTASTTCALPSRNVSPSHRGRVLPS